MKKSRKVTDALIDRLRLEKIVTWVLAVAWMALIFFFSGQDAELSSSVSSGFVDFAARLIRFGMSIFIKNTDGIDLNILSFIIRKCAHLFLYTVLGMLVTRALCPEGSIKFRFVLTAVLICFLYACSDEFHQLFQTGRSGELRDVLIDTCGAVLGIMALRFIRNRNIVSDTSE